MPDSPWNPFDDLSDEQRERLDDFRALLLRYNRKLNLISAGSEDDVREQHLLHCLTLLRRGFPGGARVVDWGTGGGLPAIPLAIARPEVTVYAVDSVGKKVRTVRAMTRRLELDTCFPWHGRAENWEGEAEYSVSRATAPLAELWTWHRRVATGDADPAAGEWEPGLLCLKGGDLSSEIADLHDADPEARVHQHSLPDLLGRSGPFWAGKKLVHVTRG
jgi:16S rRNA (guanine527-N7)-methyltransferase